MLVPAGFFCDYRHAFRSKDVYKRQELVLAWTDDQNDPQYAMSAADLELLEKETDAKGRHFTIHKLPIPALHQVVTEEDLPGYIYCLLYTSRCV